MLKKIAQSEMRVFIRFDRFDEVQRIKNYDKIIVKNPECYVVLQIIFK